MGYFPNGTSGLTYEEQYCSRCIHNDENSFCPVMLAHELYAYEECDNDSNAKRMLDMLIPLREDGIHNDRCAMFVPEPPEGE